MIGPRRPRLGWAPQAHPARWSPEAVARRVETRPRPGRVGIIGAGMAGIHMAWLLARRGFEVTVLEARAEPGGKIVSVEAGGCIHELGACYTTPAYPRLRALLDELGLVDRAPVAGRWIFEEGQGAAPYGDWVIEQIRQQRGRRLPRWWIGLALLRAITRYNQLHRQLLGRYAGSFPPRPSDQGLRALSGSFLELLERHGLQDLIPIMRLFQTAQGYGYLAEVPALYGLMWNTPDTMKIVVEQLTGRGRRGGADILREHGMRAVIDRMIRRLDLDVRLEHRVTRIEREPGRAPGVGSLRLSRRSSCRAQDPPSIRVEARTPTGTQAFSFHELFVAAPAKRALDWFDPPSRLDEALFGGQRHCQMTTTLQRGWQTGSHAREHAIDSWLSHTEPGHDHHVLTQRLSRQLVDPAGWAQCSAFDAEHRVVFQWGSQPASDAAIEERYRLHFASGPQRVEEHEVLDRRTFDDYFPHWSGEELEAGHPWMVLERQGHGRLYWIGASACFESLRDIVDYNLLLVGQHVDGTVPLPKTAPHAATAEAALAAAAVPAAARVRMG